MTGKTMTNDALSALAEDLDGPVALVLRQKLSPCGEDRIVFPPTYASSPGSKTPYALDELSDGTRTVIIDSVGSQANRMESLFVRPKDGRQGRPLSDLVPQVGVEIERQESDNEAKIVVSIMEAGHRLGDAIIRSSELADEAHDAFSVFKLHGDAGSIARLSPTTLVFGAWDSRDTQAKLPRIVQSTVRAWDVDELHRSAQYAPPVDYAELDVFSEAEREKAEGKESSDLAKRGYVHVPAVNTHGGVLVHGEITRDVTVNLIALRQLGGEEGEALRAYVLGLALGAATAPPDAYYRQGCLLTPDAEDASGWTVVHRDGRREDVALDHDAALAFAREAAEAFGIGQDRTVAFDRKKAQADSKK